MPIPCPPPPKKRKKCSKLVEFTVGNFFNKILSLKSLNDYIFPTHLLLYPPPHPLTSAAHTSHTYLQFMGASAGGCKSRRSPPPPFGTTLQLFPHPRAFLLRFSPHGELILTNFRKIVVTSHIISYVSFGFFATHLYVSLTRVIFTVL